MTFKVYCKSLFLQYTFFIICSPKGNILDKL